MHKEINSRWSKEIATWDEKACKYTDHEVIEMPDKVLIMEIIERPNGTAGSKIVQFYGGPTGFEAYYVEDLLKHIDPDRKDLCICAGTVNSWPKCIVDFNEVIEFLKGV